MRKRLRWCLFAMLCLPTPFAIGQVATGLYTYGTFDNKGFDAINVGNLNAHFSIPILTKAGRGLPFYYNLSYDSSVWYPSSVSGSEIWTPVQALGWTGDTQIATGYLTYSTVISQVGGGGRGQECIYTDYTDWVYHDKFGVSHQLYGGTESNSYPTNCGALTPTASLPAQDGSGYTLNLTSYHQGTIAAADGTLVAVPNMNNGSATVEDSNGNEISADGSGHFTDTTGNVVLTVAGSAPSAHTFTYKDISGTSRSVSMTYKTYTVQTAFGCSGVGEYGPTSTSLVDTVSFPDGSKYSFSYEATPGVSGNVTGRLASVELPQGGTVSYTYTGGSHGIVCADGSTSGLTRTINSDSGSAASTWAYARTAATATSHTEVVDGLTNHLAYDFVQASNQTTSTATTTAVFYETNRKVYEGVESGTPVLARSTCYNGAAAPCTTTAFNLPISKIDIYETLDGVQMHGSTSKFNSYGSETEADAYDFGGSSSRGSLLRKEVWTYGYSVPGVPTEDDVYDGSGNLAGKTQYGYDGGSLTTSSSVPQHIAVSSARGNLTSITQYANATTSYSSGQTYEDTGSPLTSYSPNGTSTFGYDSTFVYQTGTTLPTPSSGVSITSSNSYDTTYTGLPYTAIDPNGRTTTSNHYDLMLRPTEVDYPDMGKTTYTYDSPNEIEVHNYQNLSMFANTEYLLDGYARTSRAAVYNGQSGNDWYQLDVCYDANGNNQFASYAYQSTGFNAAKVCSGPGDSYTYDVLGRLRVLTRSSGESVSYTYTGRATLITDENAVKRILQVDGLGRTTIACEISSNGAMPSSGSPVSCGTDITGTGFTTTYAYTIATGTTTVTQGTVAPAKQTRTFQADWLGRPTLIQEPESGQTTYSYVYNSTGLMVTRTRPKANQPTASVHATTITQYDSLGRAVNVTYSDGTPTKTYAYDTNTSWSGLYPTNLKGRLASAASGSGSTLTGDLFSYDAVGRTLQIWECAPSTCGTSSQAARTVSYMYDWTGNVTNESDSASGSISYSRSPAGEVTGITNQSYNLTGGAGPVTLVSNVQNGPNGPISFSLANNLTTVNSYDSLGRMNGRWACSGSSSINCSGGTQVYGFSIGWKGVQLKNSTDSVLNKTSMYGYDEFNRLASQTVTSGTVQNFSYVYDRYGNRWTQNAPNGGPAPSFSFNTTTNQISSSGYQYDAAGNMTNDAFHSYNYDAEGNVTGVDAGGTATVVYDALNRKVHYQVPGNSGYTLEFVYDAAGKITSNWANASPSGADEGHIFWDGAQIALRAANGLTYFAHKDWVNTDRMHTEPTGSVGATYVSLAFGDGGSASGSDSYAELDFQRYGDTDYELESNTHHAQFRQYSQVQGHWMAPDPYSGSYDLSNPQSLNRYDYALNNPLTFSDPQGLEVIACPPDTSLTICVLTLDTPLNAYAGGLGADFIPFPLTSCQYNGNFGRCVNTRPVVIKVQAPNNGPRPGCVSGALLSNAVSVGIDAVGLIPEAGGVARFIGNQAGYRGVVADQLGARVIGAFGKSTSTVNGLSSITDTSALGLTSTALTIAGFIPGLGQVSSGLSLGVDLYKTYKAVSACYSHP